jgi:hypothetical protein
MHRGAAGAARPLRAAAAAPLGAPLPPPGRGPLALRRRAAGDAALPPGWGPQEPQQPKPAAGGGASEKPAEGEQAPGILQRVKRFFIGGSVGWGWLSPEPGTFTTARTPRNQAKSLARACMRVLRRGAVLSSQVAMVPRNAPCRLLAFWLHAACIKT